MENGGISGGNDDEDDDDDDDDEDDDDNGEWVRQKWTELINFTIICVFKDERLWNEFLNNFPNVYRICSALCSR